MNEAVIPRIKPRPNPFILGKAAENPESGTEFVCHSAQRTMKPRMIAAA